MPRLLCVGLSILLLAPLAACGGTQDEQARRHALMAQAGLEPARDENSAEEAAVDAAEAPEGEAGPPVVFVPEVHRLLVERCMACHSGERNPGSGFPLYDDAERDFETARAQVDTDDPEASALLALSVGEGHVAGPVFARESDAYATLLAWIDAGARFDAERAAP